MHGIATTTPASNDSVFNYSTRLNALMAVIVER